jgi:hypothetical protein
VSHLHYDSDLALVQAMGSHLRRVMESPLLEEGAYDFAMSSTEIVKALEKRACPGAQRTPWFHAGFPGRKYMHNPSSHSDCAAREILDEVFAPRQANRVKLG